MLDYSTLMSDEYFHPICIFFALHDKQTAVIYSRIHLMLNMIMTGGMLVGLSTVLLISKQRKQLINIIIVSNRCYSKMEH